MKKLSILLVDDEPNIVECWEKLFKKFFLSDELFFVSAILTTLSSVVAVELYNACKNNKKMAPDIIFSDVGMPFVSGDQMVAEIRKLGFNPVIFFHDGGQKKVLNCEYTERFIKPAMPQVVLPRIREILLQKFYPLGVEKIEEYPLIFEESPFQVEF